MSTSDPAVTSPAAITSYPALGFGQRVSLQPETADVSNRSMLKEKLQALSTAAETPQLLVLARGIHDLDPGKEFIIRQKNLTITAEQGETVILKNIKLSIDVDASDNVLIQNLVIDVWRRCPRVANGNRAHIYNNLLFRWGKGNTEDKAGNHTNEWVGMVADNAAQCVIQANRFIPWKKKLIANRTINIDMRAGSVATVDIGEHFTPAPPATTPLATPDLTNDFDGANGAAPPPEGLPPASGVSHIDLDSWFTTLVPPLTPPPAGTIQRKDQVNWLGLVGTAGPPAFGVGNSNILEALTTVLVDAAAGHPIMPDDGDDPSDDPNDSDEP